MPERLLNTGFFKVLYNPFGTIIGKAYHIFSHGLSYVGDAIGKITSAAPSPVRYAAAVGSLSALLVFTSCSGKFMPVPIPAHTPAPIATATAAPEPVPKKTATTM